MSTSGAPPDGLLSDSERERLVDLLYSGDTSEEIDRRAGDFLSARSAMTAWEARVRADGYRRFVLGNHRVYDLICQGETYQVLRGQNLFTGRVDAVKIMHRPNDSVQRRARHLRKLRIQSSIHSSRFVAVHDVGYPSANITLVEYMPGLDLRAVVRRHGPLRMAAAATVLSRAATGLGELHALGLSFTNVQSSKILCDGETTVKLCDAGEGQPLGTVFGLPPPSGTLFDFVSPEILTGDEITPASDVYSLGCVLYYAVTGKVVFPVGAENEKRGGHLYRFPIDPRRLADDLDDEFVEVIAAMMAKTPIKRIQSMAEAVTLAA